MKLKTTISVFFPCYNDEKSISKLVINALKILPVIAKKYEVIVVDDGSSDNSSKILKNLELNHKELKVITHLSNQGYGAALRTGFQNAKYDLVFYTDGDGQYDVSELPILVSLMSNDVDFVNGIKLSRQDPTYRIFIGNLYSFVIRWLFWLPVWDVDCDFRLIRRKIISRVNLKSNSGAICIELVKKSQLKGAQFRQVSVHHYQRSWGNSQFFRLDRITVTLRDVSKLWLELIFLPHIKKLFT